MEKLFSGKTVIVTGSGQGVGRAIALAFGREGANVVTNNRKPGSTRLATMSREEYDRLPEEKQRELDAISNAVSGDAETTAEAIRASGGTAAAFFGDISDFSVAEKLAAFAVEQFGGIDVLVNVAGGFGSGPIEKMSEEQWDRTNGVKPKGYFNTMRHVLPYMIAQKKGRIINCTSRAFMGDTIRHAQYCAANAGVVGLTRGAALELYEYGITVNAFGPWAKTRAAYEGNYREKYQIGGQAAFPGADITPEPDAVAPFILFLASDHAAHITGSVFTVAGNEIALHREPVIARSMHKPEEYGYWTVDEIVREGKRGLFSGYQNLVELWT